jgi:hypothetical protein
VNIKRVRISSKNLRFRKFFCYTILGRKGENIMQISYQPLWNLLETKKMKKKDLMEIADMSANCIAKMSKGEYISLRNIAKICMSLNCTPSEVFFFDDGYENMRE